MKKDADKNIDINDFYSLNIEQVTSFDLDLTVSIGLSLVNISFSLLKIFNMKRMEKSMYINAMIKIILVV